MMKSILRIFLMVMFFSCFGWNATAQNNLADILNNPDLPTFVEKIMAAENYFLEKHPDKTAFQLTDGEFRDGEYVKYRRWRHFWAPRIEVDGRLADLGKYGKEYHQKEAESRTDYFEAIEWSNISYEEDLGYQIGMGRTSSIAFHPTDAETFYVSTAIGGVWKTTDGGQTYIPIGDDLPFLAVSSIVLNHQNPDEIYIAISDLVWYGPPSMGVYKSLDGGSTWEATALGLNFSDNTRIYWMIADPHDGKRVFVATENGLYLTSDGFDSVELLLSGSFSDVKFHPVNSDILYVTSNSLNQFWRSEDGGVSFSANQILPGGGFPRIATTSANVDKVGVSTSNQFFVSEDQGINFSAPTDQSLPNTGTGITMISDLDEDRIYTGFFNLYRSVNNGGQYTKISDWLGAFGLPLIHVDYRNAFKNPLQPEYIYLCNDGGVYRLNVETDEFENLSNGLIITQFYDIAVSQTNPGVMSGGSQDNGNVFMDEYEWEFAAPTADGMQQAINSQNDFLKYNAIQLGSIFRFSGTVSTNISDNIANNKSGTGEWVTPFLLAHNDPSIIYAGYERVYRSSDNGNSWVAVGDALANNRNLDLLAIAPSDDEKIYAIENWGRTTGDIYGTNFTISKLFERNTDGTNTWTTHVLPVSETPRDIVVDPNDPLHLFISLGGYTDGHKVFESKDGGNSWENISFNLPNAPATAIAIYWGDGGHLFVGTDAGMYFLDLDTEEWKIMGDFPNTYITDIEIVTFDKLIRVGTHGRGILEANLEDVSSIGREYTDDLVDCVLPAGNIVDNELRLPFNEQACTVDIYNINGQLMLQSEAAININVTSLTKGIYQGIIRPNGEMPRCKFRFVKL